MLINQYFTIYSLALSLHYSPVYQYYESIRSIKDGIIEINS